MYLRQPPAAAAAVAVAVAFAVACCPVSRKTSAQLHNSTTFARVKSKKFREKLNPLAMF